MRSDTRLNIRLIIGGFELKTWDEVSIDSQIDTPAEDWSFTVFSDDAQELPDSIKAGASVEIYYGSTLVLTSIADRVSQAVDRSGTGLNISGRDLAGQLIDCSVPVFNGRQVTLKTLLQEFVLKGELGKVIHDVRIQNDKWLKNRISVEPGESLWDAIAKAAQVTGQYVWLEPDGTLVVGDPFANPYFVQQPLILNKPLDNNNNVLSMQYDHDISNVYGNIKVLSQDSNAAAILAATTLDTDYSFERLKIVSLGDVETSAEAVAALDKIKKDQNLEAHSLNATVHGWSIDGRVWAAGWYLNLESNVMRRTTAKWAVHGRTLKLSRSNGMTTDLKLKRQGDWALPLKYKEQRK